MVFPHHRQSLQRIFQIVAVLATLTLCGGSILSANTDSSVKVAFIGDQGTNQNAQAVLQLIADEEVDLLLIQGDLGYAEDAAAEWIDNMDSILGSDFPVLLVVGNHENYEWPAYQQWLENRISSLASLQCEGEAGVKSFCTYENLDIAFVAPGINNVNGVKSDDGYPEYITNKLSTSDSDWKICSWHQNMQAMQVGNKSDSTGWEVYEACLQQGAIVATAHEHSYSRTHLMSSFENQVIAHTSDQLQIKPGQSFVFVNGLGGRDIRDQVISAPWWASVYSSSQNANHGALFCNFRSHDADCYLKDIAGLVPDSFTLENNTTPSIDDNATPAVDNNTTPSVDDSATPAVDNNTEPAVDEVESPGDSDDTLADGSDEAHESPLDTLVTVLLDSESTTLGTVPPLLTVQTDVANTDSNPVVGSAINAGNALDDNPASANSSNESAGTLDFNILLLLLFILHRRFFAGLKVSTSPTPAGYLR